MRHLMEKIKIKAILPAAAFLAAAAIGTTFAWQTWELSVTNNLKSHTTVVAVEEPEWDPSTGVKKVRFKNTGNSSVFLRVSYTEYWEKQKDGTEYLISNTVDGKEMATKHWTQYWPDYPGDDKTPEWIYGGDDNGWYYYNKILKPGTSTELILESVSFENVTTEEYFNANYHLYFKAEAVQCSDGGNTLNRPAVNTDATQKMFGRSPVNIDYQTGAVTWE